MKRKLLVLLLVVFSIVALVSCDAERETAEIYIKGGHVIVEFDKKQVTETREFSFGEKNIFKYEVCTSAVPLFEPFGSAQIAIADHILPLQLVSVDGSKKKFELAITLTEGGLFNFVDAILKQVFAIIPEEVTLTYGASYDIELGEGGKVITLTLPEDPGMGIGVGTTIDLSSLKTWKADNLLAPIYVTEDVLGLACAFTNGPQSFATVRSSSVFQTLKVEYKDGKVAAERKFNMAPADGLCFVNFDKEANNFPIYKTSGDKSAYYDIATESDIVNTNTDIWTVKATETDFDGNAENFDEDFYGFGVFGIDEDAEYYIICAADDDDDNSIFTGNTPYLSKLDNIKTYYMTQFDKEDVEGTYKLKKGQDESDAVALCNANIPLVGEFFDTELLDDIVIIVKKPGCIPTYRFVEGN